MARYESYTLATQLDDADITLFNKNTITHRVTFGALVNLMSNRLGLDNVDSVPTNGSDNLVKSGGVYSALASKQNTLTFDGSPTYGSGNPVTSGGIYNALTVKANTSDLATVATSGSFNDLTDKPTIDDTISSTSTNAVQNATIYTALSSKADNSTTLSGYGITDAYTKTETNNLLADKADSATTLSGYGITNAYTKTEVDTAISTAISTVYKYKGTVNTYADLPSTDLTIGDTYNIATADAQHDIQAGDNVTWNGTTWDKLAGTVDLSNYYTTSQIDTMLSVKANVNDLATVATSGSYNDLTNKPTIDSALSSSSTNAVQNSVIYTALQAKADTNSLSTVATSGDYDDLTNKPDLSNVVHNTDYATTTTAGVFKVGTNLSIDSNGVLSATGGATITVDSALSTTSTNPVQNAVITNALNGKQETLTFDSTPTASSSNPVTSDGIYTAIQTVISHITWHTA